MDLNVESERQGSVGVTIVNEYVACIYNMLIIQAFPCIFRHAYMFVNKDAYSHMFLHSH